LPAPGLTTDVFPQIVPYLLTFVRARSFTELDAVEYSMHMTDGSVRADVAESGGN